MNYQKLVCWGDSQTFGARSYGCYPLYLVKTLNERTRYRWQTLNFSDNGHTARDLWFRLSKELPLTHDCHQACILIGTNDVGNATPLDLFEEYYRQTLTALQMHGFKVVYCGEIPPIWADGHAFFARETSDTRQQYNACITRLIDQSSIARQVKFPDLSSDCYTDPVHFNETGNRVVAECFAHEIENY
ncbi:MAG: SGNH/GDSL hydrolase family protein [Pseudomonadales bacterium]